MKRLLIIFMGAAMLLVGCSSNNDGENEAKVQVEPETEVSPVVSEDVEGVDNIEEEKDSYLFAVNTLLNDFDEEYEMFDTKVATTLHKTIRSFAVEDIEIAKSMKESLLDVMTDEQKEVYDEFLDKVIELEESYSHLEWGE